MRSSTAGTASRASLATSERRVLVERPRHDPTLPRLEHDHVRLTLERLEAVQRPLLRAAVPDHAVQAAGGEDDGAVGGGGWGGHAALGRKRWYSAWNTRRTVPTCMLRPLATMSSAVPRSSGLHSGLEISSRYRKAAMSASCSTWPLSRRSASVGRLLPRFSTSRLSCASASTGQSSSFASALSPRETSATSSSRFCCLPRVPRTSCR